MLANTRRNIMESGKDENLLAQLSEVEMLQSMFPGQDEFVLDNPIVLEDVSRYLSGQREVPPKQIAFEMSIPCETAQGTISLWCSLPHQYPETMPEMFVQCEHCSRKSQKLMNDDLFNYVESLPRGDLCISMAAMWLKENIENYLENEFGGKDKASSSVPSKKQKFTGISRLWIYSHHIYRKELLKKIPEFAHELDLTGFVLPGKPGIICIEGYKENCNEYWQKLKYPNWKHIACKHREDRDINEDEPVEKQLNDFRLYKGFEELAFEAHGDYGLRNDYHMDLGKFRLYLEEHNCAYIFSIFFGLEGKKSDNSNKR